MIQNYGQFIASIKIFLNKTIPSFLKLALEFGLNSQLAKEIGFFHDIGKAIDYEESFDHIKSGIQIAKKCNLKQIIIDTIAKHHQTTCNEDYVLLVKCADA
jgi:ribonuclease Y